MNKTIGYIFMWIFIVAIIIFGAIWLVKSSNKPGELDEFASCLKDKGATFYGAFWCPHCQAQKVLFGNSAKNLPYVECSTPDGQNQNEICKTAGVESYPTWIFPNGSKTTGEQSLQILAEQTGCVLPSDQVDSTTVSTGETSSVAN